MSKSITGSGSLNLTVQELRLLEIKASLISAINATIDNLLTAVNANFTGLVTITDLTISGTVTVDNITVLDTLTAEYIIANQGITGDLTGKVNVETTASTNQGALRLPMIDADTSGGTSSGGDGLLSSSHKLRFDESTGTLIVSDYISVPTLSVETQAYIMPVTSNTDTEYKVAMFGNLNVLTGDSITYNCFQNRLTVPNLQVTGGLEITPATSNAYIEYAVTFFGLNNALTGNSMTFNPLNNRLTVTDLQATDDVTIGDDLTVAGSTSLGVGVKIQTLNTIISQTCRLLCWDNAGSTTSKPVVTKDTLYYVGSTDTLHTPNVTATGDIDISGNVTTATLNSNTVNVAVLNSSTRINASIVAVATTGDFICDGTATFGDDCTISSSKDLFFTEASTTVSGDKGVIKWDSIGRLTGARSSALEARLEMVNETARPNTVGNYQIQLTPNDVNLSTPASGKITQRINNIIKSELNNTNFTVSTDMEITGDTTVTAVNATTTPLNTNCRLLYMEGSTLTGRISGNGCYYNPDGDVLFANRLQGSEHSRSPEFLISYTGQGNGQIKQVIHTDTELYLQYQQTKGHFFKNGAVTKLLITDAISTFYNDVDVKGDLVVLGSIINGVLPLNYTQSISGIVGSFTLTSNMWGIDKEILFTDNGSLYDMQTYGLNVKAWQKSSGTTGSFSLVNNTFNGLWRWEIVIDVQYNTSNSNARLNPKIYVERTRSGTAEKCFGSLGNGQGVYFRGANQVRQISVVGSGVVDCQSGDVFKIKTLANLGQNTNFGNQTILFDEKTFSIEWRYLSASTAVNAQTW